MSEDSEAETPDSPLNADRKAFVEINCNIKLSLISEILQHGVWMTTPPGTIQSNGSLSGRGRVGSAYGIQGTVVYQTPDGTQFTLDFGCPDKKANYATITGSGSNVSKYNYNVDSVGSHEDIYPTYTINIAS